MKDENNYLLVDDGKGTGQLIPDKILNNVPQIKGKVKTGTLGKFNIKDCKWILED